MVILKNRRSISQNGCNPQIKQQPVISVIYTNIDLDSSSCMSNLTLICKIQTSIWYFCVCRTRYHQQSEFISSGLTFGMTIDQFLTLRLKLERAADDWCDDVVFRQADVGIIVVLPLQGSMIEMIMWGRLGMGAETLFLSHCLFMAQLKLLKRKRK